LPRSRGGFFCGSRALFFHPSTLKWALKSDFPSTLSIALSSLKAEYFRKQRLRRITFQIAPPLKRLAELLDESRGDFVF
jgi:hypothetical protein